MKRNVVVILGLCAFASSGCGRDAAGRFGTNRFVRPTEPTYTGPRSGAPLGASEFDLSSYSSPSASRARQATAAHGPSARIRAQMLEIKESNARASVIDDVKAAFKEGTSSERLHLSHDGANVFNGWISSLERGEFQLSRLRLSRDAQFDRVVKAVDGREKIRRYQIAFGAADFIGWIEVKLSKGRWIIVDADNYALRDATEEGSVLDWISK